MFRHPISKLLAAFFFFGTLVLSTAAQDNGPSSYWFSVDAVNPELGAPPPGLDRETPQATLETFLFATSDEDYARAGHTLDMRGLPAAFRADVAPDLARKLRLILDRRVWIGWSNLTDRPDGLAIGDTAQAGEPRRSIRLAVIDLHSRPVPIRMNRLKAPDGDPVWLFSRESVENIDALYQLYGPSPLERAIPDVLRPNVVLGLEIWELIALPLLLIAAALAGIGTYRALNAISDRRSGEERTWPAAVAAAVQVPVAIGSERW